MQKLFGWTVVAVLGLAGTTLAQVRTQPAPATRPGVAPAPVAGAQGTAGTAAAGHAQQGTADQQIAAVLLGGNRNEVELAKLAQQRAKSDSVKEFASHMIKDHTQQVEKLSKMAGNLGAHSTQGGAATERRETRKVPAEEGREDARDDRREGRADARETRREGAARDERREGRAEAREDRREERTTTTTTAAAGGQSLNWVAVHQEIADQCLQSARKELTKYEGDDFDKAYIGLQIAQHMEMLDKLQVFRRHASQNMQGDLDEAIETVQGHLKHARQIMDEQKDQGSKGSSGRKGGNDQ
jgi:predicted outer membrane protein